MNKKLLAVVALIIVALLAIFLIVRQKKVDTSQPIRIGILKHESSLPIYIADDLGYFKKHGVQVQIVELPPGDHLPALLSDRVDVISPTSFPTLFGVMSQDKNLLYSVFPGAEVSDGPTVYGLVVKSSTPGESIKDIHGGVIMAINPYTQVNIQMILNSAGIQKKDWPEIRVASREAALQAVSSGTAVAAIMDQPALATAISSPEYRLLEANPRAKYIGSPYWSGAGAVKRTVWGARKGDFDKVMAAVDEAVVAIRRDPQTAHKTLATKLGLSQQIADQIGGYYFPLSGEFVPKDGIEKTIEALRESGLLNSPLPLSNFFPPNTYGEK